MSETIVWDVYQKTLEMRSQTIKESLGIPVKTLATELAIETDIAEECAIVLEQLDLIQFDADCKIITLRD